jgi:hypothetical protein
MRIGTLAGMRRFVLLALLATLAAGCGSGDEEATTVTVTSTETVTETVTTSTGSGSGSGGECSAAGLSADLPDDSALPAAVADLRQQIAEAAVACDYDRLQELALQGGGGFTYSYGGETSASDFWAGAEERGEQVMRILVEELRQTGHLYQGNWVWPTAYTDDPTDAEWQALAGLYPQEQLDSMKQSGSYLGYRVGITPASDWIFFVAGD